MAGGFYPAGGLGDGLDGYNAISASDPPGHNFTLGSLFAASTDPTSPYDFDMSLLDCNVHRNFYFQFLSAATGEAFYSAEFLVVAGSSPSAVKLDTFTVSAQFKTEVDMFSSKSLTAP